MSKQKKSMMTLAICMTFAAAIFMPSMTKAGSLEPSGPPGATMHTLDEIYDVCAAATGPGAWVEKTGQSESYEDYDDGYYEKGVTWPIPRFTDNGDGTVTDNMTGLIWLEDANCSTFSAPEGWSDALSDCHGLASGSCELTDGSSAGDWRLPNVKELQSLIDFSSSNLALPSGHPFDNVESVYYWSATTYVGNIVFAWLVDMNSGGVPTSGKSNDYYVWPVRGGND
jgi:hypothetical protein